MDEFRNDVVIMPFEHLIKFSLEKVEQLFFILKIIKLTPVQESNHHSAVQLFGRAARDKVLSFREFLAEHLNQEAQDEPSTSE
jgi:hypothetical protein